MSRRSVSIRPDMSGHYIAGHRRGYSMCGPYITRHRSGEACLAFGLEIGGTILLADVAFYKLAAAKGAPESEDRDSHQK
jgi:hypothetical protein